MPFFPVNPNTAKELETRMLKLGIREGDLDEQFVRSGGHGGQNVNKLSTCVILAHRPSGISVRCQEERTQAMNRFLARRRLADKLEEKILGVASRHQREIEKIRRQKRKRSRRARMKMLDDKHRQSRTKELRKPISGIDG
jgi:peptide chain release factor